jgi:hypothetical protein
VPYLNLLKFVAKDKTRVDEIKCLQSFIITISGRMADFGTLGWFLRELTIFDAHKIPDTL